MGGRLFRPKKCNIAIVKVHLGRHHTWVLVWARLPQLCTCVCGTATPCVIYAKCVVSPPSLTTVFVWADLQDTLFDLENGGGTQLDDSDLNEDVAKLRCDGCLGSPGNSSSGRRCLRSSVLVCAGAGAVQGLFPGLQFVYIFVGCRSTRSCIFCR